MNHEGLPASVQTDEQTDIDWAEKKRDLVLRGFGMNRAARRSFDKDLARDVRRASMSPLASELLAKRRAKRRAKRIESAKVLNKNRRG